MNEDFLVSSPWRVLIDSIVYTGTSVLVWCLFSFNQFFLFLFLFQLISVGRDVSVLIGKWLFEVETRIPQLPQIKTKLKKKKSGKWRRILASASGGTQRRSRKSLTTTTMMEATRHRGSLNDLASKLLQVFFSVLKKNHVTHFPTLSHKSATNRMDPPANRQQHLHGQTKKCTTNKTKKCLPYYAQSGLSGRDSAIHRTYNEQSPMNISDNTEKMAPYLKIDGRVCWGRAPDRSACSTVNFCMCASFLFFFSKTTKPQIT